MTYAWEAMRAHAARRMGEALGVAIAPEELVAPPDPKLGDLAYGCFKAAKAQGKNPAEVAMAAAQALKADHLVAEAVAAGPYLNVRLKPAEVATRVVGDIERMGEAYGASVSGHGHPLLFEYANPNTHKEIHVGHLRNLLLGASLVRLWRLAGHEVSPVSYVNDVGTHVAKCLWRLATAYGVDVRTLDADGAAKLLAAVPAKSRTGNYLAGLYVEATRALEEDPSAKDAVSVVHNALEAHAPAWESVWRETRRWCVDELFGIFDELDVRVERQYFESPFLDRAHAIAKELEAKGIAKVSDGALIVDMEEQKLGVMLVRKSDGALLYPAKDLALYEQKAKDYPAVERLVVLVDFRQEPHFRQVYAVLPRIGMDKPCETLSYGLVTLPEGAMSSRKGNIVTYQSLRDAVLDRARAETVARHEDWPEGKVAHVAWALAMAGMKFGTLKVDPAKDVVFDIAKALSFEGDTGPSVQYSAVRLGSILRKANWDPAQGRAADLGAIAQPAETALVGHLAAWPAVAAKAAVERRPSVVAQWLLEAASRANAFYRDVPVLDAPAAERAARLRLAAAARDVMVGALGTLGIPVPDEM